MACSRGIASQNATDFRSKVTARSGPKVQPDWPSISHHCHHHSNEASKIGAKSSRKQHKMLGQHLPFCSTSHNKPEGRHWVNRSSSQGAGAERCCSFGSNSGLHWAQKRGPWLLLQAVSDHSKSEPGGVQTLEGLCQDIERNFSEVCIENLGRPAAAALRDFVAAGVEAYMLGASRDKLSIQLQYGTNEAFRIERDVEGYRLTGSEERYRSQWLDTIYTTLQLLKVGPEEWWPRPANQEQSLVAIIHRVLEGQRTGEEQSLVKFDRALSTAGASGGAAAERKVVAPQWIPVTQLVLLTMKVLNERGR